jgi:predicted nucleotidyltransferase component of viral defense system
MEELRRHEIFELETLERLNSSRLLNPLVFGGGTMLRLCYGLDRYSVDLDFWLINDIDENRFKDAVEDSLNKGYEITDSCIKRKTILFEFRSPEYPKLLKLEIRRERSEHEWQQRIAFSPYDERQVLLKTHTLEYTMRRKIEAALDREEIRDCFDIEFLLKQGVDLVPEKDSLKALRSLIGSFSQRDFKVTLGSFLEAKERAYYTENGFALLEARINSTLLSL